MDDHAPTERRHGVKLNDLRDAEALLTYAAGAGIKVGSDTADILDACAAMFERDDREDNEGRRPDDVPASAFYNAYQSLSERLRPVTAQTLRDTRPTEDGRISFAGRWSVWLMLYTSFFLLFIIGEQILRRFMVSCFSDSETGCSLAGIDTVNMIFGILVPFAYGGLGACAFLLVSCHRYLVERSFERIRRHEYWSRLLLGVIAGGTILLFMEQVIHDDGTRINISSAALAFVAGYNVDFLFQTIERLMQAILPKVDLDSVARAETPPGPRHDPVDLAELLRLHNDAPDEAARDAIGRIIEKLTGR